MGDPAGDLRSGEPAERRPVDLGAVLVGTETDHDEAIRLEAGGGRQGQGGEGFTLEALAGGGARQKICDILTDRFEYLSRKLEIVPDEHDQISLIHRAERPECDRDTVRHDVRFPLLSGCVRRHAPLMPCSRILCTD